MEKDELTTTQNNSTSATANKIFSTDLIIVAVCFLIALGGFAYILLTLPGLPSPSPVKMFKGWKLGLIIAHVLVFVLIPLAMRVFYESLKALGLPYVFASQLGLAFIMVAIASEIGWHVSQSWFYQNQFTMLNFMFYFFLISAFALWSDSLLEKKTKLSHVIDILFAISLLVVSIFYSLGASQDPPNDSFKIPIYIALTLVFGVLTYRGYQVLKDWKIILVPIFSVGVNLAFISLLDKYVCPPYTETRVALNALFHILHDVLGTELGIAIFTYLIYSKGIAAQRKKTESASQT